MTDKLRNAAQLALEALLLSYNVNSDHCDAQWSAITALRESCSDTEPAQSGQEGERDRLTGDDLRRIARSARTSASDHASPEEYVLAGWRAARAAPQPVVREPLTDEQVVDLYFDGFSISKLKDFARAVERAHGITQKGGS